MSVHFEQRGMSLIEVLVGLTIGLVALLVIGQVMAVFEAQKRTSTGGGDAQTNGAAAMQVLEQELRMSGLGLVMPSLSSAPYNGNQFCPLGVNVAYNGTVVSDPGVPKPSASGSILAPVRIIDGAAGVPDQLIIARSDAEFGVLTSTIRSAVDLGATPVKITVDSSLGFEKPGQLALIGAANGSKVCTLLQVSKAPTQNGADWDMQFDVGSSYPYNSNKPGTVFASLGGATPTTYGAGDKVVNLGFSPAPPATNMTAYRSFMYQQYSILKCDDQAQLAMVDPAQTAAPYTCANSQSLVDHVVDLQAQYGIAPSGSLAVKNWVDAKSAAKDGNNWAYDKLTAAQINQIKAVRIAVVAQSPQYIKNDASCSENPVSTAKLDLWPILSTADDDAPAQFTIPVGGDGCQHYRYKVFTTVVPLKNAIWSRLCYDPATKPCS